MPLWNLYNCMLIQLYQNGKIFLQHHSWRLTNSRHISSVTFRFDVLKLWSFSSSRETPEKLIRGYSQQNMYPLLLCVLYSTLIPQILNPYFTLTRCITRSNMKCVLWNWQALGLSKRSQKTNQIRKHAYPFPVLLCFLGTYWLLW